MGAAFGAMLLLALLAPALAQQAAPVSPPPQAQAGSAPLPASGEIQLVFEREVFRYIAENRRDPFTHEEAIGPFFDDLSLRMIIHSPLPNQSVVLMADGSKKVYRLRRGDVIGNATVLEITPTRVVFSVEDFGNRRQEVLDIKAKNQKEGA
jgi:hypothetical protein